MQVLQKRNDDLRARHDELTEELAQEKAHARTNTILADMLITDIRLMDFDCLIAHLLRPSLSVANSVEADTPGLTRLKKEVIWTEDRIKEVYNRLDAYGGREGMHTFANFPSQNDFLASFKGKGGRGKGKPFPVTWSEFESVFRAKILETWRRYLGESTDDDSSTDDGSKAAQAEDGNE